MVFSVFMSCAKSKSDNKTDTQPLTQTQSVEINNVKVPLTLVGKAIRTLWFFDIYSIQLWASDPKQLDANQPLEDLNQLKSVAIHITTLRSTTGEQMKKSMKKALEHNKVSIQRPSIQNFLEFFNISLKKQDVLSITGNRQKDETETLEVKYSGSNTPLVISEPGIIQDIFSIWLGNTSYSDQLTKMKNQLLSGN